MLNWILQYWMGILFGALTGFTIALWQRLRAYRRGLVALLHNSLVRDHDKYMTQGSIPVWAMENISSVYAAYIALEKNPTITKLYEELRDLPSKNTHTS